MPFSPTAYRRGRWLVSLFFLSLLVLGLSVYRDYGVPWDEPIDRDNGAVSAKYVAMLLAPELARRQEHFALIPELATYKDRDHGVVFELPAEVFIKALGIEEPQHVYQTRHLLIFLLYLGGVAAFYGLLQLRFRDWRSALAGAAVLFFTPRLFADSFYNNKDGLFVAFFTLAVFTLARLLRRSSASRAIVHGLATALAMALRINAVMLVPLTLLGLGLWSWRQRRLRPLWPPLLLWLVTAALFTVLLWPYLWANPWANFAEALASFSRFARGADAVLYWGKNVSAFDLPWHYTPVWMLITTPVAYTALFGFGAVTWLVRYLPHLKRVISTYASSLDVLAGAWLLGPLVAVVVLRSVLYDGWRHLYFVYPALVFWAVHGLHQLLLWHRQRHSSKLRLTAGILAVLFGLASLEPLFRIWQNHPNQQAYFTLLPPSVVETGFELDYWGLAHKQGLEWIARHDTAARISVTSLRHELVFNNLQVLPPEQRRRFKLVWPSPGHARYFLTNYRWHPEPYPSTFGEEVYSVRVNGVRILSVFRRPE